MLAEKDVLNYSNKEKGLEGERRFDKCLESLSNETLILHDLLLEHGSHQFFQIDTLMILQRVIYHFEVKNYQGVHYIEKDKWYRENGVELTNPIHQMKRCATLLNKFLQPLHIPLPIKSYVIFIHPEITLFQAPRHLPIILPTQLKAFLKKLNSEAFSSKPIFTSKHEKLANYLLTKHMEDFPYTRVPEYDYDQLQKGIPCCGCSAFLSFFNKGKLVCRSCGYTEAAESGVLRSVEEYKFLFPDRKMTVNSLFEWCGKVVSPNIIRRVLQQNFKLISKGRSSYYV
nr:nuclease-related domain-containing protein [Evansella caseinilytica]